MLRIWKTDPYSGTPISLDGTQTAPLFFLMSPTGGVEEVQLWLRHDELSGEGMESSYGVTIEALDDFDTDESSWIEVAEDSGGSAGTYGASLAVGDILGGMVVPIWVRLTMPSTPETGARTDIYLSLASSATSIIQPVVLSTGTFTHCEYDADDDDIKFDVSDGTGEWTSDWIDTSAMSDITYADVASIGTNIFINYRASSDATEATATAWFGAITDVPLLGYLQIRVQFVANSFVGQTGLVKRIYSGLNFNTYKTTTVGGTIPSSSSPGDSFPAPKSVKWGGYFYAPVGGNYAFRMVSNDGHRMYVGTDLIAENWTTTVGNATVTSTGIINLLAGWHPVEWQYYHSDGTNTISTFVDPPNTAERAVALADFAPVEQVLELDSIDILYGGTTTYHGDILIYDGPDVPVLIEPESGFETKFFSPDLTVSQQNCEYVEFQMDNSSLFASTYLTQWIEPVTPGEELVTSHAPDGSRPSGIWYWRARGIREGIYSAWSDYRFIEILELIPYSEFLYLNVNIGLVTHDPIIDYRYLYVNANVGLEIHDSTLDDRFIYTNVNVDLAVGRIIYPMQDFTPVRKTEFDTDDEFLLQESE